MSTWGRFFVHLGETEAKGDRIYLKSVRHDSGNAEAPEQLQPFYQVGGKVPGFAQNVDADTEAMTFFFFYIVRCNSVLEKEWHMKRDENINGSYLIKDENVTESHLIRDVA